MTVSYQYDVASSASGGFIRLLFRWRGSVWKVVYREMSIFTLCYVTLTILYKFALTLPQQKLFEKIVYFCSTFMEFIPLSFMLGFYVSFIAARWWSQFIAIPWPDKLMNIIAMYIPGLDESSRVVRRTLMRYLNLSLVLVLRSISMAVKRRFPTKEHLIEAGFMTKTELEMFQSVPSTEFNTFWIPCTWFINVLREARQECRITDSNGLKLIMEELNEFRSKCGLLWSYDWISIPLVYTQVVTMATYAFYVACMFGRQNVNITTDVTSPPKEYRYDYYVPVFTILQLMFYMGLLKVAEQLINPFGDDDEDFELNWIIDRHMKVSYLGVDTLNITPPPLVKDTYYNELDVRIPYTEASKSYKKKTYRGSVAYMQVPMEQQGMVLPDMSEDEDDGEMSESMGPRRPSVYTLFHSRGSNCKGVSPASSFTNLETRSVASVDSEFKSSLPNLSSSGAKNASGTMGQCQAPALFVDMATAEDDEIVLQEVIIEPNMAHKPPVARSDSLQIPGTSGKAEDKKPSTVRSMLRGLSPKIAPKFPREKLKSMFKKSRKMSAAFPFYKLKGVRFSRDTKEDESIHRSLLDVSMDEPVEVDITLSTPELTEIEKETGIHPYYFTQQTITSAKELATGHAFAARQTDIPRYGSQDEKDPKVKRFGQYATRSSSLPNIRKTDNISPYIHDPIIEQSLKKITETMKSKEKEKKPKKKRKSPPPPKVDHTDTSDVEKDEKDVPSDTEQPGSRESTLPQIMLTRCGHQSPVHLDLATTSSGHSSSPSSDSGVPDKEVIKASPIKESPASAPSIQYATAIPPKPPETPKTESISSHSKPKPPPLVPKTIKTSPSDDRPRTEVTYPKRRSPPPHRPSSLTFASRSKPPKKIAIAGIALKSSVPPPLSSPSSPTSPTIDIPTKPIVERSPRSQQKHPKTKTSSPKSSPTREDSKTGPLIRSPRPSETSTTDSQEDLQEAGDQVCPPEAPQRHLPRTTSKTKK